MEAEAREIDNANSTLVSDKNVVQTDPPNSNNFSIESFWESAVRVSLASFGGSLVGMALQKQQPQQPTPPSVLQQCLPPDVSPQPNLMDSEAKSSLKNESRRPSPIIKQLRPPSLDLIRRSGSQSMSVMHSLPGQWTVSCFIFAMVLETSRRASPTGLLLNYTGVPSLPLPSSFYSTSSTSTSTSIGSDSYSTFHRTFLTVLGDYSLGGAFAGVACGWALSMQQLQHYKLQPSTLSPPSFRFGSGYGGLSWGLRVGLSLGIIAGFLEGSVDVLRQYSIMLDEKAMLERIHTTAQSQQHTPRK